MADSEITTGEISATHRQPTVFDYSQSNQFKVFIPIFPITEWFVVRANIPSVNLGQADQYTPFINIGLRQVGRERGNNVIDCEPNKIKILKTIDEIKKKVFK